MSAIELRHVDKFYGKRLALSDFSLNVETGERVVIHGPSGCGKTTVLRLIAGFVAPDRGLVTIGGKVVAQDAKILIDPEHRNLGMVSQDLALWPHLTVRGNLEFALKAQGLSREIREKRIQEMLARVRLNGFEDSYSTRLSGGQQQRVAVARALVSQPLALLMDEPLSNLDDDLKEELLDHILELHAQLGFTLIYVTHSRQEIERLSARVIRMPTCPSK
jgi:ABC-type Fe3+/spermidine/putrescine transport system ATPase subunit